MHKCSFSMKSSMSGRTLAATNDRHFLQVDSVSWACREFKLRRKKPCSGAISRPLGGVLMVCSPVLGSSGSNHDTLAACGGRNILPLELPKGLHRAVAKNQLWSRGLKGSVLHFRKRCLHGRKPVFEAEVALPPLTEKEGTLLAQEHVPAGPIC